jgi:hypothetical protein
MGMAAIASGVVLPAAVYGISRVMLASDAAKGGPPNQGAMVIAYLATCGALGLGVLFVIAGVIIVVRSRQS